MPATPRRAADAPSDWTPLAAFMIEETARPGRPRQDARAGVAPRMQAVGENGLGRTDQRSPIGGNGEAPRLQDAARSHATEPNVRGPHMSTDRPLPQFADYKTGAQARERALLPAIAARPRKVAAADQDHQPAASRLDRRADRSRRGHDLRRPAVMTNSAPSPLAPQATARRQRGRKMSWGGPAKDRPDLTRQDQRRPRTALEFAHARQGSL